MNNNNNNNNNIKIISKWIKNVLSDTGIDSTAYTAHSTRAASPSAVQAKNVSIENIM